MLYLLRNSVKNDPNWINKAVYSFSHYRGASQSREASQKTRLKTCPRVFHYSWHVTILCLKSSCISHFFQDHTHTERVIMLQHVDSWYFAHKNYFISNFYSESIVIQQGSMFCCNRLIGFCLLKMNYSPCVKSWLGSHLLVAY